MRVIYAKRKTLRNIFWGFIVFCIFMTGIGIYNYQYGNRTNSFHKEKLNPVLQKVGIGLTKYEIDVVFSPQERKLECKQRIKYINAEDMVFGELYFHLYPNAFEYKDKSVFPMGEMERAYPNGFSAGSIKLHNIKMDGKIVEFSIDGYSGDILMISPPNPIKPGKKVNIDMEYSIQLPNSPGRFGYGENSFNIANWYPILCVYDEKGWNVDPYYPLGDPFYSDVSNYQVTITAPQEYVVAFTGDLLETVEEGGRKTWKIQAVGVRDFAWIASDKFKVSHNRVGDTDVYSYHYTVMGGRESLDYASNALEIFNGLFGIYPYNQLSVVQTDFFIGGMEYPNLIMVDGDLYKKGAENWLEIVTVHEVAHQWWYGMVGNNQIYEAWLDEALTEYSTILYFGQLYGTDEEEAKYQEIVNRGKYQLFRIYNAEKNVDETIHRPLYEFDDWIQYDCLVYGKGAIMIYELRNHVGDEAFFRILKEYFAANCFKNATGSDFIAACRKITGKDWEPFFVQWLYDD